MYLNFSKIIYFGGGQREAEIGLWESRKGTTKDICHCRGNRIIDIHRDKGRFVVANGETSCRGEIFENVLEHMHGGNVASGKNQGIICILEHRVRKRGIYRIIELAVHGGTANELLKDVSDDNEQVWGNGVSLPKPAGTSDPSARHSIQQNCGLAASKNI